MKKQLLIGLLGAAGGLGLAGSMASCDDYRPTTDMDGKLLVSVDLDKDVVASAANKQAAPASRAEAQSVSASDLSLKLTSESGSFAREWAKASDFSEPVTVPVGKYTLEAWYGSLEDEGFEKPYYHGSSTLTVEENRTTPVSVTASLANSMVRVEMSDMFRDYFASYTLTLRSELNNEIAYADGETRPVYLAPGQVTASITITKQNGTTATLEPKSFTAEARHSYLLKFDINGGEAGDGFLVLTYDDMTDMENVEIDLSDEILNAPAPRLTTDGFTPGESWTVMQGQPSEKTAKVTAIAQAGIDGLVLTTTSAYLESQGWPKEIDLVSGDASTIAMMKGLGLRVAGTAKPDKMALVDFTDLLSNIAYIDGGDNTSAFTLQVRDRNSRVAEVPVGFSVETVTTTLSVVSHDPIYEWDTTLAFDIESNASDLTGLTLQAKNDRNTWDNCPITSCQVVSRMGNTYHVVATVPSTATDLPLRLTLGALKVDFTVAHEPSPYSLTAVENGIYGWQAALDLRYKAGADGAKRRSAASRSAAEPENVTFELSADNGQTWSAANTSKLDTNRFLVKGLTGGKTYQVRATCDGILSGIYTFTTEIGDQLENSDMETWFRTDGKKGSWPNNGIYWWKYYPSSSADSGIWGTMNLLTTSFSGTRDYTAYCNFSGTHETDDAHTGNKAALIETVGWGANAANGSSQPKSVTVGELYVGTYDSASNKPVYGHNYGNRPHSLTFWYKYAPKNQADYGLASIKILDKSGVVLAEDEIQLSEAKTYTERTINLASLYAVPCAQAASIQVVFKSSGNPTAETNKSKDWLNFPDFGNLSDGRFTGSSLYIDDIKLNF